MEPKAKPRLRSKGTELAPAAAGRREGPAAAGGDLSAAAAAAASMGPIPSLGHANLDGALANPGLRNWGSPSALRWLVGDWEIRWVRLGFLGARLYIGGGRPRGQSTRTETKQPSPCSSSRVLEQVAI